MDHLSILSGIQPAELRRMRATLSLVHRVSLDPVHILHGLLSGSSDTRQKDPDARLDLLDNLAGLGIRASEWTNHKWKTEYCKNASRLLILCPRPVPGLLGWAYPEQLRLSLTACGLVLGNSIRPCTNGISLLHRVASVAPRTNRIPCSNSVPYTSGTTRSTRSNGFG